MIAIATQFIFENIIFSRHSVNIHMTSTTLNFTFAMKTSITIDLLADCKTNTGFKVEHVT